MKSKLPHIEAVQPWVGFFDLAVHNVTYKLELVRTFVLPILGASVNIIRERWVSNYFKHALG